MSAAISVQGLTKSYGAIEALRDVEFVVDPGEAVALLGPNGSGKTTALRTVAGLLRPDGGVVEVFGRPVRRCDRELRRHVSYLPQQASFPPSLTVREIVELHARLRGVSGERIAVSMVEAGLGKADGKRVVGELSGGMRQRLSLCVAGLGQVKLMLLDEPTANLDPDAALRLRRLAAGWRDAGRALLISTHVLDDVEQLADKVVVLVAGRVVAVDNTAQLRADIRQFAELRVNVGRPTDVHVRLALDSGATDARLNSHSIIIKAPVERRYEILRSLGQAGPIHHFDTEEPSLEQIYVKYVRDGVSAERESQ